MDAVFKKINQILLVVFLILALIWSGLCVFMFAENRLLGIGDIIACSLITSLPCLFGIIPFLYNRKAFLHVDDNKISGKFGFFKRLECEIRDVDFVLVQFDAIHILLKNRKYYIRGIKNPMQIGAFIMPKIPFLFDGNRQDVIADLKKRRQDVKKNAVLIFCTIGLAFVWLVVAILLIGSSKEFSDFTRRDWGLFAILCLFEIPTVTAMFVFARKAWQANPLHLEKQLYGVRRTMIETTPLLKSPWKVKAVLTDAYFHERITIYSECIENDNDTFCYRIERFDANFNLKFFGESKILKKDAFEYANREIFENYLDITTAFQS